MKEKYVFLDFFGVISSEIAPVWLSKYLEEEIAKRVKEKIFNLADNGDINEEETYMLLSKETGIKPEKIKKEFEELVTINWDIVEYIRKLKRNYHVFLLSNAIDSYLYRILEKNNLIDLFEKAYISSEIHHIKPNDDFFEYVIKDSKVDVRNAIFVDDNPKNVHTAVSIGMQGVIYTNNITTEDEINSFLKK